QLAMLMEDERMMHPLMRVPVVDIAPLAGVLRDIPEARLVLLNALGKMHGELLRVVKAGNVYVEISALEGVGGVSKLLRELSLDRVLFGSHSPFFYFESALLKLKESPLSPPELKAIRSENAKRLMASI